MHFEILSLYLEGNLQQWFDALTLQLKQTEKEVDRLKSERLAFSAHVSSHFVILALSSLSTFFSIVIIIIIIIVVIIIIIVIITIIENAC